MKNKTVKIITSLCLIVMMISATTSVFALQPSEIEANPDVVGTAEITNVGKSIVGILQTVGILLSVIILIILGIKYMMGSAEEKAEYKKTMMPYIIGAALIFAASAFAQVVYSFFSGVVVS